MKGFDPKFADIPDYILGVTKEIWEDRKIASLDGYYAPDIIVRSPASVVVGNQGVIAATMATLAEFPDRALLGEDVIWYRDAETGVFSSHRLVSTATHTKPGVYGAATGATLRYRIIADCHVINNQIDDEWLIRDQGAIVRQMGISPKDYARDLIVREGGPEQCVAPYTPKNDIAGPYSGTGNDDPWGARLAAILQRIMAADFAVIPEAYDRAAELEYPGGLRASGFDGADGFWMGLRASFPNAEFKIDHAVGRHDPTMPPRAALRWTLHGQHEGYGAFGEPTGAKVFVMGATHAEFGALGTGEPKLRREWTLIDETAIWKQILLQFPA
ncbi:MAG: ester cyclase [Pseudomonadota bacterium]